MKYSFFFLQFKMLKPSMAYKPDKTGEGSDVANRTLFADLWARRLLFRCGPWTTSITWERVRNAKS